MYKKSDNHDINTRQNSTSTNIQQIYLYFKKELAPLESKCSIASLKVSKEQLIILKQN
jgi:hypothetical protein